MQGNHISTLSELQETLSGMKKEHLGSDTRLRPKAWKAEAADLTAQKDRLYREVRKLEEEVAEAETVKRVKLCNA